MNDRDLNSGLDREQSGHEHTGHEGHEPTNHELGHIGQEAGGHSHRWLMLACCIPMVLIVLGLLGTGAAGAGAIVFAAICVGMMALMMFAMPGGHKH